MWGSFVRSLISFIFYFFLLFSFHAIVLNFQIEYGWKQKINANQWHRLQSYRSMKSKNQNFIYFAYCFCSIRKFSTVQNSEHAWAVQTKMLNFRFEQKHSTHPSKIVTAFQFETLFFCLFCCGLFSFLYSVLAFIFKRKWKPKMCLLC